MNVYNENRDKNKSMHDEIREQNAKLKNASFKEKLSYFKEYYLKSTIVILAIVIFSGSLIYSLASAPDDTAFVALFYNDMGDSSSTALADDFAAYMEIDTKEHEVYIDAALVYQPLEASSDDINSAMGSYEGYMGLEKSMALISTKELDIIVGNESTFDYFSKAECFHDLTTILPAEQFEKLQAQNKIYYYTNEETGETLPLGIFVQDAPKLQEHYYYNDAAPALLGFIVNSNSMDNALAFYDYIYMSE